MTLASFCEAAANEDDTPISLSSTASSDGATASGLSEIRRNCRKWKSLVNTSDSADGSEMAKEECIPFGAALGAPRLPLHLVIAAPRRAPASSIDSGIGIVIVIVIAFFAANYTSGIKGHSIIVSLPTFTSGLGSTKNQSKVSTCIQIFRQVDLLVVCAGLHGQNEFILDDTGFRCTSSHGSNTLACRPSTNFST